MPFIPPDPGRILRALEVIKQQLVEVERSLEDQREPVLAALVHEVHHAVTRIEKHINKRAQAAS